MNPVILKRVPKFSGLFDNILQGVTTGFGIYSSIAGQQQASAGGECPAPAGCLQCRMRGRGGIAACLDLLWFGWRDAVNAGASIEQQRQILQAMKSAVNNDAYFAQDGGGDTYLANTKSGIDQNLAALATATPTITNTATGGSVVDNIVSGISNSSGGITLSPNVLLIGAVGIGALILIMKKK